MYILTSEPDSESSCRLRLDGKTLRVVSSSELEKSTYADVSRKTKKYINSYALF